MVTVHYSNVTQEWIIKYHLEDTCTQTIRTKDHWAMQKYLNEFLTLEKGVANGKKYYTVPQ